MLVNQIIVLFDKVEPVILIWREFIINFLIVSKKRKNKESDRKIDERERIW